jgi:hypothetical protein
MALLQDWMLPGGVPSNRYDIEFQTLVKEGAGLKNSTSWLK